MALVSLYDYQIDAVEKMKNGCILCGGVGSGKSRTALAYYYTKFGGEIGTEQYVKMKEPKDLYIITTARKRDTLEWEEEFIPFLISTNPEVDIYKDHKVVVDSWNNIQKYAEVKDAFFIFDEQRVIGYGKWTKAFLRIAKTNRWILLSATPGDTWSDYIPVFIANGFYRNKTEFTREHIVYSRYTKYPKVERYLNTGKLVRYRNQILVDMKYKNKTISHHIDIPVTYDIESYKQVGRLRWDPFKDEPIQNAAGLCYVWRKVVNGDEDRIEEYLKLCESHPKSIVFYNFDYELDILRSLPYLEGTEIAEWNGHNHQPIPESERWVYLVQYAAGCEGWNCIKTDTIIFFSQTYSYKVTVQAAGRIDRLNTPFTDLYFYHLKSKAPIDLAIARALKEKRNFNANAFVKW